MANQLTDKSGNGHRGELINRERPVNLQHPLTKGLVSWHIGGKCVYHRHLKQQNDNPEK